MTLPTAPERPIPPNAAYVVVSVAIEDWEMYLLADAENLRAMVGCTRFDMSTEFIFGGVTVDWEMVNVAQHPSPMAGPVPRVWFEALPDRVV